MSEVVIQVENVSKQYRLGKVGTGTISNDFSRWWSNIRGKEDPFLKIGDTNDRTKKGNSDFVWALKNIDFSVKQGEVLGIIGKNGAGKSTLLKILSRVTTPTTGTINVNGRIASLLEVGTGFHPELSGRENIFLNGAILGMTKHEIKSKFDEILAFSGVERYVDTPVKRYSSGMYVRLAFAVAAHLEPEILIVDEVLAVGDAEFQKKCIGKMKDVSGEGRTVLFVSHNMAAVKSLCNTGIILQNGEIIYSGDAETACGVYLGGTQDEASEKIGNRIDRKGNASLIIEDIFFTDNNQNKVETLISGEYCKLNLAYNKKNAEAIKHLFVGVTIKNDTDATQTVIATDELGLSFDIENEKGIVEIEFQKLLLRGGMYSITIQISSKINVMAQHVLLDKVENAIFFNVEQGDYWNVGNINRKVGYLQDAKISVK